MGLFSKPEAKKSSPKPALVQRTTAAPETPTPTTVVGRETHIKGELLSSDNVRIEGHVEGKIKSTKQVVIGESGQIQAEVEAVLISIRGKLEGNCLASTKVEVTSTGKVYGNICAPRIAVAEGAIFRGSSKMAVEKKPPPQAMKPPEQGPKQTDTANAQSHPPGSNPTSK